MADDKTLPPATIDIRAEMDALRAVHAPVVYFDFVGSRGAYGGIGNITLECGLHLISPDGKTTQNGRQVTAHLRFPLDRLPMIREALDGIELLVKPPASGEKN